MVRKGKTGDSHWFTDFVWDFFSAVAVGVFMLGIPVALLLLAGRIARKVIGE